MQKIWRRENEGLVIGDDVFVTVLQVGTNYVRLGISCARQIPSYWEETLALHPEAEIPELELTGARF